MVQISEHYKAFFLDFGIVVTSCLIHACGYILNLIWRVGVVYTLIISFAASLMIGVLVMDSKSALVCMCASLLLGSAIAALILIMPVMIEEPIKFDIALTVTLSSIAKILLFNLITSFVGVFAGLFMSGNL